MNGSEPTPVKSISYYTPPEGCVVSGLDQKVRIPCGDFPLPLLVEDIDAMDGPCPSYDAVGRGVYHVLRARPDCAFGETYARILREGYPHFVSEMASQILMLDRKDVDVAYLDRKINYLKIFFLMEPANAGLALEIGLTFKERGLRIEALHLVTASLFRAEEFLRKGVFLAPEDPVIRYHLGEVSYILGKYDDVLSCWHGIISQLDGKMAGEIERRRARIEAGVIPRVPAVDYLEAIGASFSLYHEGEYAEAAGVLTDVLDDPVFVEEFPILEMFYVLGLCCERMGMPRYAEEYYRDALRLNPGFEEARTALTNLGV